MLSYHSHLPVFTLAVCRWLVVLALQPDAGRANGDDWVVDEQRDNIELRSEFPLDTANLDGAFVTIQNLEQDLQTLLRLPPGSGVIEINLFRTKSSYQSYLTPRVPEGVSRQALFVSGVDRGRVYVYRHWGYETDLRHECTHALLHNSLPFVPMWLDEGLAEYFEVPAAQRAQHHPHLGELRRRMLIGWNPDLKTLESKTALREMDAADYRESWAWVHFMLHGPIEVRQILADYLYDVEQGHPAGLLGVRLQQLPNLDDQLVRHLRNWK